MMANSLKTVNPPAGSSRQDLKSQWTAQKIFRMMDGL